VNSVTCPAFYFQIYFKCNKFILSNNRCAGSCFIRAALRNQGTPLLGLGAILVPAIVGSNENKQNETSETARKTSIQNVVTKRWFKKHGPKGYYKMLPQHVTTTCNHKKRHTQNNQTRTTAVAQRSSQQVHAFDRVLFRRHSVMFGGDFGVRRNPFPVHIHVAQLNARLAVALASRRSVPGRALR
jgi:hypothetical protein